MFQSIFFTKLRRWEYWPIWLTNIPLIFIWLYFAMRSGKLFFFSAVNPVIETGGVFGESKINILRRMPQEYIPLTIQIPKGNLNFQFIKSQIQIHQLSYPVIFKPNIGERGFMVSKIFNESEIQSYLSEFNGDLQIQELVDLPLELSVMYNRLPGAKEGAVTSICIKKNLSVVGDGKSSIEQLMQNYHRARLQLQRFKIDQPKLMDQVLPDGEELELEPIGNHSRGTTFLNGNKYIDETITKTFDQLGLYMHDIYYGRFDLKCNSIEELRNGVNFKILEFNGVAGEPAHIFDPAFPVWKAYRDIYRHWKVIYQIAKIQIKKGIPTMSLSDMVASYRQYSNYMKSAKLK